MKTLKVIEWILAHLPVYIPSYVLEKLIPMNPSHHGKDCLYNGERGGIEIACDNCPFYTICFQDWKEYTDCLPPL